MLYSQSNFRLFLSLICKISFNSYPIIFSLRPRGESLFTLDFNDVWFYYHISYNS